MLTSAVELKYFDAYYDSVAMTAGYTYFVPDMPSGAGALNTMAQGDGPSDRDGRSIVMESIHVQGAITIPEDTNLTAGQVLPLVYVALVMDTQTNGAAFAVGDLWTQPTGTALANTLLFRNLAFAKRFRVLAAKHVRLRRPQMVFDGTNIELQGAATRFSLSSNLNGQRALFEGTTNAIADATDNTIQLIVACTDISLFPTLTYVSRLRFRG